MYILYDKRKYLEKETSKLLKYYNTISQIAKNYIETKYLKTVEENKFKKHLFYIYTMYILHLNIFKNVLLTFN